MTSEVDNLVQRVARLERQNRQLKIVGLGIALGMASFLLMGAAKTPKMVEAEKIVILDRHGRARITIGTPAFAGAAIDTNPDDPMIWLTDDKGADRAMLATDGLSFGNSKARPTVRLSSDPNGLFGLKFYGTLHEDGNAKGVPPAIADKLSKLLLGLETAETLEQLGRFPGWKLYLPGGDLNGLWSLTVTGNWRLIFRSDEQTNTASDIDLIDYH